MLLLRRIDAHQGAMSTHLRGQLGTVALAVHLLREQ